MRAGIYCTIYQVEYTTESRLFHRNSNVKQHASSENHCYNLIYAMQYNVALHIVFYSYISLSPFPIYIHERISTAFISLCTKTRSYFLFNVFFLVENLIVFHSPLSSPT